MNLRTFPFAMLAMLSSPAPTAAAQPEVRRPYIVQLADKPAGEGFRADHCNRKLIGARYFNQGFLASGLALHWTDFASPRDSVGGPTGHGGHGTHTAGTAGGNGGVPASVGGAPMGEVSGMAPRARIAMYKVCWTFAYPDAPDGAG